MNNKEIAERLREIANREKPPHRQTRRDLNDLADSIYPPRPEPGRDMLSDKDIAEIIRRGQDDELKSLAEVLDPPRPEPGTVVWWRYDAPLATKDWSLGKAYENGVFIFGDDSPVRGEHIEYKPARILAPDEVAVKVPPVSSWNEYEAEHINVWAQFPNGNDELLRTITRAEAERMEVSDE